MNATTLKLGQRVQLHPACDEWMQGARYGLVVGFGRETLMRGTGEIRKYQPVKVLLDKSGRVRRFHPDNVLPLESEAQS